MSAPALTTTLEAEKLATVIVFELVPAARTLSVTARFATYVPLVFGVKVKFGVVDEAKALPFLVTLQAYWRPAVVAPGLASVTVLLIATGRFTEVVAGAP